MNSNDNSRNVIINNVTFFWAKLDPKKPVEPFGTSQWELQIRFPSKRDKEMAQFGKIKPVEGEKGMSQINLKKKAELASGEPAKPVLVVDTKKNEIDPKSIGNGSKGNVMVLLRDYEIKGPKGNVTKSGTSVMLTKVQVTELVEFKPTGGNFTDFDYEENADNTPDTEDADF
jgi:hypothetical protein